MKIKIVKSSENCKLFDGVKMNFDITTHQTIPASPYSGWMGNHFMERGEYSTPEAGNSLSSYSIDALGGYFNENF